MSPRLRTAIGAVLIAAVVAAVVWVTVWGTRTDPAAPDEPSSSVIAEVSGPDLPATVQPVRPPDISDPHPVAPPERLGEPDSGDGADRIAELYETEQTEVQVRGEGVVARTLSDDTDGDRHQRFILELSNGMTVLVAHNIDDFPRLEGLAVGDRVAFHGEYVWGEQGGTIHWTHRDNHGDHPDGWLEWNGKRYW